MSWRTLPLLFWTHSSRWNWNSGGSIFKTRWRWWIPRAVSLFLSLVLFSDKDNRFHWLPSSRNLRSSIPPAFGSVHVLYKALTGRDRVKAKRHPSPSSWALLVFSAFLSRDIPTAKATGSTPPNRRRNGAGDLCLWRVWRLCCFGSLFRPPNNIQVVKMSPQKEREREAGVGMSFPAEEPDLPQFYWFFPPIEALLSLLRQPILMAFYCLLLDFFFFFFSGRWNKALRLVVLGGGIVLKVTPHHAPSFSSGWPLSPGSCYYVTNRKWLASPSGLRQKRKRSDTATRMKVLIEKFLLEHESATQDGCQMIWTGRRDGALHGQLVLGGFTPVLSSPLVHEQMVKYVQEGNTFRCQTRAACLNKTFSLAFCFPIRFVTFHIVQRMTSQSNIFFLPHGLCVQILDDCFSGRHHYAVTV